MDIKNIQKGEVRGVGQGRVEFFFDILLYYFINVMLKTLYIINFIFVYVIYFTHSLYCYVLTFFTSAEKMTIFLQEIYLLPQFLT